uniref:VWFA domain-containing protein n=1 Tax=Romanomermis culicivorax TaxID=13658 RepID=A0A915KEU8_ROMCU
MGDTFCHIMGAAHWFIVLDASGNRSKDYLYEGQQLAKRMGQKLLDLRTDIKTAYKFRFSITLVSDQIVALRQLCDDESKTLPIFQANTPISEYSLMDEALRSVEMQSDICSPNSTTQRIVLYIAQSLPNKEALKILDRWHEDLRLRGIRSTQVYFFVISKKRSTGGLSKIAKRLIEKFSKPPSLRSLLNLDPDLVEFKDVQGILGGYAVQCACRFSEDCVSINGTVVKPCHFNLVDAKEHCTTTIDEIVSPIPVHSRYPNIILPSCKRTRPPNKNTFLINCGPSNILSDYTIT